MIDEHNLVFFSRSEGGAYKSSHAAELCLNAAILRAELSESYEEFLDIFETFYADDVEVRHRLPGPGLRGAGVGKERHDISDPQRERPL